MTAALSELLSFDRPAARQSVTFGTRSRPKKKPITGERRDQQKSRVYASERSAHERTLGRDIWTQDHTNDRLQARCDEIMAMRAIQSRWGQRKIHVELGRYGGHASGPSTIDLGVKGRNDWVMIHEIAHCLTWHAPAHHGPEFAGVLLFLTKTVMGQEAYDNLLADFRKNRVRRTNKMIPAAGTHKVVTKAAKAAKKRAVVERPTTLAERREAASVIRRAVKQGLYGPSGCKPRTHALATARLLEK